MTAKAEQTTRFNDSPAAWFVMLEIARKRGDFEQAARAQRELKRLGVEVRYHPADRGAGQ